MIPVAGDAACAAGRRKERIDERTFRRGHRDRHREAVAVRDVGDHHRAQRRVDRRLGEREGRIDASLDLIGRAGEIDRDLVARNGHLRLHDDELRVLAQPLDVVGKFEDSVGKLRDFGPGEPLRVGLEVRSVVEDRVHSVAIEQLPHLPLAAPARGDLRLQVAHDLLGGAHVERNHVPQRVVRLAAGHELDDRQPQPFLEDLLGAERVAAGDDPAHVGVMRHRGRPRDEPAVRSRVVAREDGCRDVDVGQVLAIRGVGVVEDEHVARVDAPVILADELAHRVVEAAHVHGRADSLGQGESLGVDQGGGEVERIAHDPRVRGAHQGQRHVVGDGVEAALHQLELEGVDVTVRRVHGDIGSVQVGRFVTCRRQPARGLAASAPGSAMMTLPSPSRRAVQSGGTTHVPSYSSMISGAGAGLGAEPAPTDHGRFDASGRRAEVHRAPRIRAPTRRGVEGGRLHDSGRAPRSHQTQIHDLHRELAGERVAVAGEVLRLEALAEVGNRSCVEPEIARARIAFAANLPAGASASAS